MRALRCILIPIVYVVLSTLFSVGLLFGLILLSTVDRAPDGSLESQVINREKHIPLSVEARADENLALAERLARAASGQNTREAERRLPSAQLMSNVTARLNSLF